MTCGLSFSRPRTSGGTRKRDGRQRSISGLTALLVEDERLVRMTLRHYLERAGLHVLEARCGREALERCAIDPYAIDVMVTDVILPGMAGNEVAARVCRSNPDVAVVYISGHEAQWLAQHGHVLPLTPVLQKPFSAAALIESVRDALAERLA